MLIFKDVIVNTNSAYCLTLEYINRVYYIKAVIKNTYIKDNDLDRLGFNCSKPLKIIKYRNVTVDSTALKNRALTIYSLLKNKLKKGDTLYKAIQFKDRKMTEMLKHEREIRLWKDLNYQFSAEYPRMEKSRKIQIIRAVYKAKKDKIPFIKLKDELNVTQKFMKNITETITKYELEDIRYKGRKVDL